MEEWRTEAVTSEGHPNGSLLEGSRPGLFRDKKSPRSGPKEPNDEGRWNRLSFGVARFGPGSRIAMAAVTYPPPGTKRPHETGRSNPMDDARWPRSAR